MKTRQFGTLLVLVSGWLAFAVNNVNAQQSRELSAQAAARVGLVPLWSTAISTGYGGKVTGATVHISQSQSYQVIEITDSLRRKTYFTERDLGRGGTTLGVDQVSRLAELKEAELKALGRGPVVEVKSIPDITIYLRSSLGIVMSLDAETGRERWTTQAGVKDYPNYPVAASDELLVTISGSTLYVIDAPTGRVIDTRRLMGVPTVRPSLQGGLVYAPTLTGLVEVYELSNLNKLIFTLGSSGRIRQPLTVAPESISWTTDRGYIYVSNPGQPGISYRFQTLDTISAAPVRHEDTLFATSMDGFVYAIDERSGEVNWRHSVGEPIGGSLLAIDDSLYVISDQGQMVCLDADQGTVRWLTSGIDHFLAASENRLYCIAAGQLLAVLDRATGDRIGETQLSQDDLPFINTKTDRVYLVGNGTLQCLAEMGRRWPLTRIIPTELPGDDEVAAPQEADEGPAQPLAGEPPPTAGVEPDEDDPFGDGFGERVAEPMEAEDEPGEDEDPFGGDDPFGDSFGEDDASDDGMSDDESSEEDDPFGDPF